MITSARASLERGDFESERASLERVLALDSTNKQARLALTDALMRLGRLAEAEGQARIVSSQFPKDTEPVFLLADIALRRGDPETARQLAARLIASGSDRPQIYKLLAIAEYALHDNEKFETHIRAVLGKNSRDAEAQYFLARYLYETQRYSESLKTFQTVLTLQPDHYKAHYYFGLLHEAAGEADLARAEFLAAIEIVERKKVTYAWPYADLGRALNEAGDPDQAIEWLSRGIRIDPTCPKIYYEYAKALFQKGASPQVEQALSKAIRLDPGYTDAYYVLARYYRKSGAPQEADQILAKFKDLKEHPIPSPYGLRRQ